MGFVTASKAYFSSERTLLKFKGLSHDVVLRDMGTFWALLLFTEHVHAVTEVSLLDGTATTCCSLQSSFLRELRS